jgi:hypothetical protein
LLLVMRPRFEKWSKARDLVRQERQCTVGFLSR